MTEDLGSEDWQHYSITATKSKRADLVCLACHIRKVKCDLKQQKMRGCEACSNCNAAQRVCHVRLSKREKRRKVNKSTTIAQSIEAPKGLTRGGSPPPTSNEGLRASSVEGTARGVCMTGSPQCPDSPQRDSHAEGFLVNESAQNIILDAPTIDGTPIIQHNEGITGLADTTLTQKGDVDAGFLKVYAQENQFDAETQAIVAQMEHRYCSALDPDLEQTFTDTYFEYCYPWCPVLDRATIACDISRSPLLANALALASSHIRPPLLPHSGPDVYYKRARTIFYEDQEADEIMALKALCLFYWWAPKSPNRVHRHSYVPSKSQIFGIVAYYIISSNSSWWWTSVIIRHAQQMNIHREPSLDDARRHQLQLGLRRRIWWTVFVSFYRCAGVACGSGDWDAQELNCWTHICIS